jgi:Tfp pilus assembly protein PilF
MAQKAQAKQVGELALSAETSDGVVTSELGLAARYYQQGNYVQAELTYRKIQARMESTLGPNHPRTTEVLRLLSEVNVDLGNYNQAEEIDHRVLLTLEKNLGPGARTGRPADGGSS